MIQIPSEVQGLVFDCDGTIADTMPLHYEAWSQAFQQHGQKFPEALFYEMAGIPTAKIVEILNERHGWKLPVEETAHLKEQLYVERIHRVTPIEPVVKIVKEYAGKLPMAVATGATRAICIKTLSSMDILQHFKALVTADDVERGKPAPDIFLEAARRLGVPPKTCYAFEDGDLGLQSARSAGMIAIDVRPMYLR
jgi:beta-phosphoglucomutase family hydrolase